MAPRAIPVRGELAPCTGDENGAPGGATLAAAGGAPVAVGTTRSGVPGSVWTTGAAGAVTIGGDEVDGSGSSQTMRRRCVCCAGACDDEVDGELLLVPEACASDTTAAGDSPAEDVPAEGSCSTADVAPSISSSSFSSETDSRLGTGVMMTPD